jgi:hypothetical protein
MPVLCDARERERGEKVSERMTWYALDLLLLWASFTSVER